jgi:hypothetical protein
MRTRGPSWTKNSLPPRFVVAFYDPEIAVWRVGGTSNSPSAFIHRSNTARQASLRLAFCRRKQAVIARTFGISLAQSR